MKTLLFVILFPISSPSIFGQTNPGSEENYIFIDYEEPAKFPFGRDSLYAFIYNNLKWPAPDFCGEGISVVQFTVRKNGQLKDFKIVRSLCKACNGEVFRIMKLMRNWIPGTFKGKVVEMRMLLPIKFKLE